MISRLPPPIVLGLFYMLARSEPDALRLRGRDGALVGVLFVATAVIGLHSGVVGASG